MTESNNPPPEEDWGSEQTPWGQPSPPPPGGPGNVPQQPPAGAAPFYGGAPAPKIPNYLVHSILATILCCLPTGIVGIIYASQVNSKLASGDIAGAQKASQNARLWTIISVVAGLVFGVIYLLILMGSQNQ